MVTSYAYFYSTGITVIPIAFQLAAIVIWYSGLRQYNRSDKPIGSNNMELSVGHIYYIYIGSTIITCIYVFAMTATYAQIRWRSRMSMNDFVRCVKIRTKVTLVSMNCELGKSEKAKHGKKVDGNKGTPRMTEPFIPNTPNTVTSEYEIPRSPDFDENSKFDQSEKLSILSADNISVVENVGNQLEVPIITVSRPTVGPLLQSPLYQRRQTKQRKITRFELPPSHRNSDEMPDISNAFPNMQIDIPGRSTDDIKSLLATLDPNQLKLLMVRLSDENEENDGDAEYV